MFILPTLVGKYVQADSLCMDSLDDCILSLGPNHPTTQTSVVTVAQLKHAQGTDRHSLALFPWLYVDIYANSSSPVNRSVLHS